MIGAARRRPRAGRRRRSVRCFPPAARRRRRVRPAWRRASPTEAASGGSPPSAARPRTSGRAGPENPTGARLPPKRKETARSFPPPESRLFELPPSWTSRFARSAQRLSRRRIPSPEPFRGTGAAAGGARVPVEYRGSNGGFRAGSMSASPLPFRPARPEEYPPMGGDHHWARASRDLRARLNQSVPHELLVIPPQEFRRHLAPRRTAISSSRRLSPPGRLRSPGSGSPPPSSRAGPSSISRCCCTRSCTGRCSTARGRARSEPWRSSTRSPPGSPRCSSPAGT